MVEKWKVESWKRGDMCAINQTRSSGSMETEEAEVMWARSVVLLNAEYTSLLGNGDAAAIRS